MRQIYLDYNATTPIAPSVYEAMRPFLMEHFGNPSSHHPLGIAAHQARGRCTSVCRRRTRSMQRRSVLYQRWHGEQQSGHLGRGCGSTRVSRPPDYFGDRASRGHRAGAVSGAWGCDVTVILPDRYGCVSADDVEAAIREDTVLVSMMHANNEIGTIQPIREIAQRCRAHGVTLHTDAAQSVGKIRLTGRRTGRRLAVGRRTQVVCPQRRWCFVCSPRYVDSTGAARRGPRKGLATRHRECRVHRGTRSSRSTGGSQCRRERTAAGGSARPFVRVGCSKVSVRTSRLTARQTVAYRIR